MAKYIITSEPQRNLSFKGDTVEMTEKRGIFYLPSIGRRRLYKQNINSPTKGLKLLEFKTKSEAQKRCDDVNNITMGNDWNVECI